MDLDCAVEAVKRIKPKMAVPMHFGVVDVVFGGKPMHIEFKVDPKEFKKKVGDAAEVQVLTPGKSFDI
jgi:L-ascorbate metabolism protein UlaG (beta-lactamase superfamily)